MPVTLLAVAWLVLPVTPAGAVLVQVYFAGTDDDKVMPAGLLLQIGAVGGVAVSIGSGVTVTFKVDGVPGHRLGPALVGVITYDTTAFVVAVGSVLTNRSFMELPVPLAVNPVAWPEVTLAVHANVLPGFNAVAV